MRRLTGFLVLVLSLMLATGASAKEITAAKVCGVEGCHATKDRAMLEAFMEGGPSTLPPNPSPWYRVRVSMDEGSEGHWFSMVVVPSASMIRGSDDSGGYMSWVRITPEALRVYRKLARGLTPFPAAKLTGLEPKAPKAQVDEVIRPPRDDGDSSPLPWIGGGIALLAAGGVVLVRRRR
jgi:LPXTG-motif cell wall-anchored protein